MVQHSHPHVTAGKTIALTRRTFAGKEMSLLFNTLSRFVIPILPRSKHDDLIQSPSSSRYSSIEISYQWSVSSLLFKYL